MKYIGNILSDEPISLGILFKVVQSMDDASDNVPTLIIGWEKTKELYPSASIIEWNVADNVYWTYGKYERRDKYEENIKKFQEMAFKRFLDTVGYAFYDVIVSDEGRFDDFIEMLKADIGKTVYVSGDMMYVYIDDMLKVLGVSLRDCDYVDKSYRKRIFSTIYGSKSVKFLKNGDDVPKEIRVKAIGRAYILPYLCS